MVEPPGRDEILAALMSVRVDFFWNRIWLELPRGWIISSVGVSDTILNIKVKSSAKPICSLSPLVMEKSRIQVALYSSASFSS